MRRPVIVLLLLLLLIPGSVLGARPAADLPQPVPADLAADLQLVLDKVLARKPLAGVTAAVVLPDGRAWTGAAGLSDVAHARPMRPRTQLAVGSITKTFVAATVLQLAEEGLLGLDDPLARWVPSWPGAGGITLRQMLSHTSGLYDYFMAPSYESLVFGRPRHHWTTREILGLVRKPYFAPGAGYAYSNTNYILLGRVIRRVTGNDPAAEIRRRFLDPMELRGTVIQGHDPITRFAAHGYLWTGSGWAGLADGTRYRPNTSAATVADMAGATLSTALDIARWGHALYGGSVLQPASLEAMETVTEHEEYGLGARRFKLPDGHIAWGHGGSLRGSVSLLWHVPGERLTVTVLTNRGRVALDSVGAILVRHTLRWLRDQPPPPPEGARRASDRGLGDRLQRPPVRRDRRRRRSPVTSALPFGVPLGT